MFLAALNLIMADLTVISWASEPATTFNSVDQQMLLRLPVFFVTDTGVIDVLTSVSSVTGSKSIG